VTVIAVPEPYNTELTITVNTPTELSIRLTTCSHRKNARTFIRSPSFV